MRKSVLGVIGSSSLSSLTGLQNPLWRAVHTSFGAPSDELLFGTLEGTDIVFLPRHGRGHVFANDSVNYRANIDALKRAGVTHILATDTAFALDDSLKAANFVVPDQLIDQTHSRETSFFGDGLVAEIAFDQPFSPALSAILTRTATGLGLSCQSGGTALVLNGSRSPTKAEAALYRSWGCSFACASAMPEALLAREAELPYALLAHTGPADSKIHSLICAIAQNFNGAPAPEPEIAFALDHAIRTTPDKRAPVVAARLDAVAGRVL